MVAFYTSCHSNFTCKKAFSLSTPPTSPNTGSRVASNGILSRVTMSSGSLASPLGHGGYMCHHAWFVAKDHLERLISSAFAYQVLDCQSVAPCPSRLMQPSGKHCRQAVCPLSSPQLSRLTQTQSLTAVHRRGALGWLALILCVRQVLHH